MWSFRRCRGVVATYFARYGTTSAICLFYVIGCMLYLLLSDDLVEEASSAHSYHAVGLNQIAVPPVDIESQAFIRCSFGSPCMYPDEVNLRIIVLAYNRMKALSRCLQHLQNVELDDDKARMEIWIDRDPDNNVDNDTLTLAQSFAWTQGQVTVHVQEKHAGVYGQWINTWRPRASTREIAVFLEDDMITSPYFYRWLKGAYRRYGGRNDISGFSLQEENVKVASSTSKVIELRRSDELVYLYRVFGTWGFAPHPDRWRQFQDWFRVANKDEDFRPYVERAALQTSWYKQFEAEGRAHTMWSMWFIYFTDLHNLWTVYANINQYTNKRTRSLVTNSRENGMHYAQGKIDAARVLMRIWDESFLYFSENLDRFDYDGRLMREDDD